MTDLPAPLVQAEVDLRSYDWFPFFHKRLRHSAFWKRASDLACRISVDFWSEAYEQVPAGSVPNDDFILADWAGFGRRDLEGWLAVKSEVMSAWTLCSDGRWYHPTLSEVACQAWVKRRVELWQRECDRIRKENKRRVENCLDVLPLPPKPTEVGADPVEREIKDQRLCSISGGNETFSSGRPPDVASLPAKDQRKASGIPAENSLRETGTVRSSFSLRSKDAGASAPPSSDPPPGPKPARRNPFPGDAFERWYAGYPNKVGRGAAERAFDAVRKADDVAFQVLLDGRDAYIRTKPADRAWCNPATWLNQKRWLDQPAGTAASSPSSEPRVDLGGGIIAPYSSVRRIWSSGRWPNDWGPAPDRPDCRIPPETMAEIMEAA